MIISNYKNLALAVAMSTFAATATGCGSAGGPISMPSQFTSVANQISGGVNGCLPINQPIGFQATGAYMDTQSIYAGNIPAGDRLTATGARVGQVIPSAGTMGAGAYMPVQNSYGTLDGNITLNATPTAAVQVAGMGNANISGTITLSQAKLQIIYGLFGLNYGSLNTPYNGGVPQYGFPNAGMPFNTPGMTQTQLQAQSPCVSAIAISMSHYGTTLYNGRVYLYLNGQQHGDYLQF